MRFIRGNSIIDRVKPWPIASDRRYLWASWRMRRGEKWGHNPKPNQIGGWLPGRWRWAGLQPRLRVINPAPRYERGTRQANEIRERRAPFIYPWDKRKPKRPANA